MRKIYFIILPIIIVSLLEACGGSKEGTKAHSPYARKPLAEVTQEQLALDSRLIDALTLQEGGRADEALTAYAKLTAEHPDQAAAWYEMGRLLMQRGWTDSALACASRAVALADGNLWYRLSLVQVHKMKGDLRAAAADWEAVVKQHPDVLDYYYELSNTYIELGDLPAAIETLNRVERRIGITEPISLQKQRLWEAAGKPDKAAREIEALANAMPQERRYNAIMAEMNMKQKRFSKAKLYYDRILASNPDDPYIHIQLAEYYKQTNHPDDADREMIKAFENKGLDGKSKLQLLGSFYTNEEFYETRRETTFRLLDMAMADCTDSTEFALFYGDVLMRQQKYVEAAHQFELSLSVDSSRYEVWEALLICMTECPDADERLYDRARRAEALFPMHTLPYYLQAMYFLKADRHAEALEKLQTAVKWGFNKGYLEADCYAMIAECYYRTAQYDQAWKYFDKCLALRPDEWSVLNNYAYYLAEQGIRLEEAERMSRRTIEAEPDNASSLDTYAWILHLLGRDAEALPYMEKALGADAESASETLKEHYNAIRQALKR